MSKRDYTYNHPVNLEEVIKENLKLRDEISKYKSIMDKDEQTLLIKEMQASKNDVQDENEDLKEEIDSLKKQNTLFTEIVMYEQSSPSRKGRVNLARKKQKTDIRAIRDAMMKVVFPYMKFVEKEDLQKLGGLSRSIMQELNIGEGHRITWWATHYEMVGSLIVEHKSKAAQKMKHAFKQGKSNVNDCITMF